MEVNNMLINKALICSGHLTLKFYKQKNPSILEGFYHLGDALPALFSF